MLPAPASPDTRFSEDGGDVMYLRDVARLVATERRQKRLVLSGEIITSEAALKQHLTDKLAMHSTNVRKSFRRLDRDYSGCLDRYEFRRFLENLNIHTTFGVFNALFDQLDNDKNGTVEFKEFMKHFGPAIAGEELPIMMDGENRQTEKFQAIVRTREARAGCSTFNAEEARKMLSSKLATMSNSVRKIFQHANTDFQTAGETEGGLNKDEFMTILDKFNIPMKKDEFDRLYDVMDPDGSGCITFNEFKTTFGKDISGGDSDIRWGATAVPKTHEVASKFSTLATAAERNASGPSVQSGGSLQATGTSGSLVQKEIQFNEMPSEYQQLQGSQPVQVPRLTIAKKKGGKQEVVPNPIPMPPPGGKMTKAAFVLQRRQQRDADKQHAHQMLLQHLHHQQKNPHSSSSSLSRPQQQCAKMNGNTNSGQVLNSARSNNGGGGGLNSARSGVRDLSNVAPMTNRPLESARRLRDTISQRERLNKMQQIQLQQQQQQQIQSTSSSSGGRLGTANMTMTSSGNLVNMNMSVGPTLTETRNFGATSDPVY